MPFRCRVSPEGYYVGQAHLVANGSPPYPPCHPSHFTWPDEITTIDLAIAWTTPAGTASPPVFAPTVNCGPLSEGPRVYFRVVDSPYVGVNKAWTPFNTFENFDITVYDSCDYIIAPKLSPITLPHGQGGCTNWSAGQYPWHPLPGFYPGQLGAGGELRAISRWFFPYYATREIQFTTLGW